MWRIVINYLYYYLQIIFISFFNAIVELIVAIRSIMICLYWMGTGFTIEFTVETEDGEVIHHFPQLND